MSTTLGDRQQSPAHHQPPESSMSTMAASPATSLREIVELACRAPSLHNTQPWRWRVEGSTIELHADRSRHLPASDPLGRSLAISCGAAAQHAYAAASALGYRVRTSHLPEGPDSTLMARLELSPGRAPRDSAELLRAISDRCTDRRRFTSWPVPAERLQQLASTASEWGAHAVPVVDSFDRVRIEMLAVRAAEEQGEDPKVAAELAMWVDRSPLDGVPSSVLPVAASASGPVRPSPFGPGRLRDDRQDVEGTDGLLLLCGPSDDLDAWLRTGEALSALWLRATVEGLSVVPLSQVVDVDDTREVLRHEVLGGMAHPLMLVRVGWQPISRRELSRTPRRPLEEVLDPS